MSSNQKRGFRLPWAGERPEPGDSADARDPATLDDPTGEAREDLGDGPFGLAAAAQDPTTDAAPAAPDVPDATPEAAMMDADANQTDFPAAPTEDASEASSGWPSSDRRRPDRPFTDPLPVRPEADMRVPRRDNPLVAGLVKAMREAAIASRDETTARLAAEASARVEAIRGRATTEAAGLRKRADDDVSAIREWSKAEMARVRQETEERIEARKGELAAETERHAASVDRLVGQVQATVDAFEADMERFFTELLAETDPARLATLAEQAPDPPDLSGDGPAATDFMDAPAAGLEADDAAEAEAEASEGLDTAAAEAWPATVLAAARRMDPVASPADANGPDSTRLLVSGLTSVAGISAFKGALGQLAGVRSVSVSTGEQGVFVFAVSHDPGVDLDSGVGSLTGFTARITDATDDGFTVLVQEPAA
jgi:hypothetical protein